MRIFSSSYLPKLALVGSLATALVSCEEPELPEAKPVTASTVGQAVVRVVNAAPGTTGSTVSIDNATAGSALPYLSSAVVNVNAGQRLLGITDPANIPTNAPAGATPRALYGRSAYVGGTSYTVFITDQPTRAFATPVTASSDQGGVRSVTVTDNLAAPATGRAKVRFFNMSPSLTTAVGVFNSSVIPPAFLFTTRGYRAVSTGSGATLVNFNNFTEVAAGTYLLDVRSATAATPVVATKAYTFEAGKIYTLYTSGLQGNTTTPLALSVVNHN